MARWRMFGTPIFRAWQHSAEIDRLRDLYRVMYQSQSSAWKGHRPWAIAHRGASLEAPENTLAAFQRAMELGADFIELDVHQTLDGHVVVIHDETVDRTTDGSGWVGKMTLGELRGLDAGGWMDNRFAGERVPTLWEVLQLTRGQVGLAIEIKAGSVRYPGIEAAIAWLLRVSGRREDVIVISNDCRAIARLRQLDSRIATACFRHGSLFRWRWYRRLGLGMQWHSDYLFAWPEQVTRKVVEEAHNSGLGIVTSLEREPHPDPALLRRLVETGIDGIITDDVALLVQVLSNPTALSRPQSGSHPGPPTPGQRAPG